MRPHGSPGKDSFPPKNLNLTRMLKDNNTVRMHKTMLILATLLGLAFGLAAPAHAQNYLSGYSGGYSSGSGRYLSGYSGSSYTNNYRYYGSNSASRNYYYRPTTASSSSSERLYHYRSTATGGRYNFRTAGSSWDSRTGYSGAQTTVERQHRSAWEAYLLRLQREANADNTPANSGVCGNYLRAPAHCRDTTTRYDPVRYVEIKYVPEVSGAYR